MTGKGSAPRPFSVSSEIYAENYRRTFQTNRQFLKCPVCGMRIDTDVEEGCDRPDCPLRGDIPDDSIYD